MLVVLKVPLKRSYGYRLSHYTSISTEVYEVDVHVPAVDVNEEYLAAEIIVQLDVSVRPQGPLRSGDVVVVNVSSSYINRTAQVGISCC